MNPETKSPATAGTKRHVLELLQQTRELHHRELTFAMHVESSEVLTRSLRRLELLTELIEELELAAFGRVLVLVRDPQAVRHG